MSDNLWQLDFKEMTRNYISYKLIWRDKTGWCNLHQNKILNEQVKQIKYWHRNNLYKHGYPDLLLEFNVKIFVLHYVSVEGS